MDRILLEVNEALRSMGAAGFETQTLVWLDGRLPLDRMRTALRRLNARHPIITSRLQRHPAGWQWRSGAETPALREATLKSGDIQAVLDEAARLLTIAHDLERSDPIRWHVLHLPEDRDVFLMQYNHLLMDNNAAPLVLRELDQLSDLSVDFPRPRSAEPGPMSEYLHQFSLGRRLRAAWRTADLRLRVLGSRPVILGRDAVTESEPHEVRIIARTLDLNETQALLAHTKEICGFPAVSMAILSSAFRALGQLSLPSGRRRYIAGIGIDLGLRGATGPIFDNLVSLVPISADESTLRNRDALVRQLNQQLRDRLAGDHDLGLLELAHRLHRFPGLFRRWTSRLVRSGYSLWYGSFGSADLPAKRFCGTEVADVRYVGPCWSPVGLTLLVNPFRGRTAFQLTYHPRLVPPSRADQFLDTLLADLLRRDPEA